ncbi:MAG: glycogen debranching enzyme family protein [Oligoflexia bacterium]|nr:glycogen debranching enzyme family protein [Oligoflexia bacterium]
MNLFFTREECCDLERSLEREWLDVNGNGGHASTTIAGINTRKYHGLLNVPIPELGGKFVLLSKLDLSINSDKGNFPLHSCKYPGTVHPDGHRRIESFAHDLYPTTTFHIDELKLKIQQSYLLVANENTLLIQFKISKTTAPVSLRFEPLLAYRNIHHLTKSNYDLNVRSYGENPDHFQKYDLRTLIKFLPYAHMPSLYIGVNSVSEFYPAPLWFYNVEYPLEQSRGFDYHEDIYSPGMFERNLDPLQEDSFIVYVSTEFPKESVLQMWNNEVERRQQQRKTLAKNQAAKTPKIRESLNTLKESGQAFIIHHPLRISQALGPSIIAGYPWFGEWGRDTMISVPGLTFYSGKATLGHDLLTTFASYANTGLLPNYLPERKGDTPAYNSVDASLWFFWALQESIRINGDQETIKQKFSKIMKQILENYLQDQVPCAHLHPNGLLWAGDQHTQLTWMDAVAFGHPVTPRHGYAVEINALWYNALNFYMQLFSQEESSFCNELTKVKKNFLDNFYTKFWNADVGHLADSINENHADFSLRPNQLFAISLPFSPLKDLQKSSAIESIFKKIEENLLTPYGLRTLSPQDEKYRGHYHGNSDERDSSYHQGTIWPWLLGHFIDAELYLAKDKGKCAEKRIQYLAPLLIDHLDQRGIKFISEIFEGNSPHRADGCIAQAWSVAEVIRGVSILLSFADSKSEITKRVVKIPSKTTTTTTAAATLKSTKAGKTTKLVKPKVATKSNTKTNAKNTNKLNKAGRSK